MPAPMSPSNSPSDVLILTDEKPDESDEIDEIIPVPSSPTVLKKKQKVDSKSAAAASTTTQIFTPLFDLDDSLLTDDGDNSGEKKGGGGVLSLDSDSDVEDDGDDAVLKQLDGMGMMKGVGKRKRSSGDLGREADVASVVKKDEALILDGAGKAEKGGEEGADIGKLVPDREDPGTLFEEIKSGRFTEDTAGGKDALSQEDVKKLLEENNRMADATEELQTPVVMNVTLMKHQRQALAWMVKRETLDRNTPKNHPRGGILADDQGLGKTLSALALIYHNKPTEHDFNAPRQTLIVCPVTMMHQWHEEIMERTVEGFRPTVLLHHGNNRARTSKELRRYDIVLTTYSTISMEYPKKEKVNGVEKLGKRGPLYRLQWFRVILDESQAIKNRRTNVWSAAYDLDAERRWCLSGTPIQNSIDDLYSLFIFLRYIIVESYVQWKQRWKTPMESSRSKIRERVFKRFQAVLGVILLRRVKSETIDGKPIVELPPKTVETVDLVFSAEERSFYKALEKRTVIQMSKYIAAGNELSAQYMFFLTLLLRLRQTCGHPSLCDWHSVSLLLSTI